MKRHVALKLIARPSEPGADDASTLRDEAAALASVRSDHVVQVYAFGPYEGSFYFAMEYVNGPTLEKIIREYSTRNAAVPVFRAVTLLRQTASGLGRVHDAGLVHRDVKPSNIVVEDDSGRPVLIDFGISAQMQPSSLQGFAGATVAESAQQHLLVMPSRVSFFRSELAPFDGVIAKCLEKKPSDRFAYL